MRAGLRVRLPPLTLLHRSYRMNRMTLAAVLLLPLAAGADEAAVKAALAQPILTPRQSLLELQDHVEARLPKMPAAKTPREWEALAAKLRQEVLDRAVL